jgi:integrase
MLERKRKREVKAGTYVRGRRPTMPFGEYLKIWGAERINRNSVDDRRIIKTHLASREWLIAIACEELRPRHAERLVRELKTTVSAQTGRPLAEKYVSNIYGLFCTACSDARRAELMFVDPCLLPRGLLSRKYRRGTREPYTAGEVGALVARYDEASLFAALLLLTGMREGEACGLRFRDVDLDAKPLGCIELTVQYEGQLLKAERGARERSRRIPIHPLLAEGLAWWCAEGFERTNCRKPTPDDFLVPRREQGDVRRLVHHTRKTGGILWQRARTLAGVRNRTLHSTRHTFITMARRGGARAEVVERITHNASAPLSTTTRTGIGSRYARPSWRSSSPCPLPKMLPRSPKALLFSMKMGGGAGN